MGQRGTGGRTGEPATQAKGESPTWTRLIRSYCLAIARNNEFKTGGQRKRLLFLNDFSMA